MTTKEQLIAHYRKLSTSMEAVGANDAASLFRKVASDIHGIREIQHFNKLSERDAELLSMIGEEAGEVCQALGKIFRHGLDSYHPDRPVSNNRQELAREIGQLVGVFDRLVVLGVLDGEVFYKARITKMDQSKPYLHHQGPDPYVGHAKHEDDTSLMHHPA